jgi:hypothetical protein
MFLRSDRIDAETERNGILGFFEAPNRATLSSLRASYVLYHRRSRLLTLEGD